jgi:hypothetical protein
MNTYGGEGMNIIMVIIGAVAGCGGALFHNSWIFFILGGFFLALLSGVEKTAWCSVGIVTSIIAIWVLAMMIASDLSMEIDLKASIVPFFKSMINPCVFLAAGIGAWLVCKTGKEKSLGD